MTSAKRAYSFADKWGPRFIVRQGPPHRHLSPSSERLSSLSSDGSSTPVSGTDVSWSGTDMPDPSISNDRFLDLGASGGLLAPARGGGGPNPARDLLVVMDMAEDEVTELGVK